MIHSPELNQTLNSLLGQFLVEMTHSGKSYYSFQPNTYLVDMNYQANIGGQQTNTTLQVRRYKHRIYKCREKEVVRKQVHAESVYVLENAHMAPRKEQQHTELV